MILSHLGSMLESRPLIEKHCIAQQEYNNLRDHQQANYKLIVSKWGLTSTRFWFTNEWFRHFEVKRDFDLSVHSISLVLSLLSCLSWLDLLVEFGRADDGDGLWQHHLVWAVSVQVNAGQEGRLSGVSLWGESQRLYDKDNCMHPLYYNWLSSLIDTDRISSIS